MDEAGENKTKTIWSGRRSRRRKKKRVRGGREENEPGKRRTGTGWRVTKHGAG